MAFVTEKQVEDWLVEETRFLTMPDHSARPFRMTKLDWHAYDFLIKYRTFGAEELIRKVIADSRQFGLTLDWLLPATCSYYYGWIRKELLE